MVGRVVGVTGLEVVEVVMSGMLYFEMTSSLMKRSSFTESDLKVLSTPCRLKVSLYCISV